MTAFTDLIYKPMDETTPLEMCIIQNEDYGEAGAAELAAKDARLAELEADMGKIHAEVMHLMATIGYTEEQDWLGPYAWTIKDIAAKWLERKP